MNITHEDISTTHAQPARRSMNYRRATVHPDFTPVNTHVHESTDSHLANIPGQRANRYSSRTTQRLYNILHIICIIIVFAPSLIIIVWALVTAALRLF
jgi:lipopolysaccharide/colanic/teichoic acid biosynthesis glycosyltransferase